MSFTDSFIKKPIMTTLLMVLVMLFGAAAFFGLPISDLPVVDSPVITVTVSYPGADPDTMASTVAAPLETQFMQIPGLQSIISTNTDSQTQIMLTFDLNKSVDLAAPDVQAAITRATANLPTDLPAPPTYTKTNPSDTPIMYLMVSSDSLTPGQLYDYANRTIGQRISMLDGVSQVQVYGSQSAVRVQVDPSKLASYGIGLNEVAAAVQNGTVTIPGGSLNGKYYTFSIQPQGQMIDAREYDELIVAYRNGAPVRFRDIATCVNSTENDVVNVTAVSEAGEKMHAGIAILPVFRQVGSNTVALAERIKQTVEQLKLELPGSVKLSVYYDKSESIVESINDVKNTIVIALVLVILVIFLFLGRISDTIIPAITLPISIVATFLVMAALGFSLDNLSLMGIILAVGFVVDDAIVVLENTVRLIEQGEKPFAAAMKSAREISFTILSMTLSLAVIFIPLVFMGGVVGRIFREFAITVVVTILCSGVVSLTLSPMMCARMLKAKEAGKEKENFVQRFMNSLMGKVIGGYSNLLKKMLHRPFITIVLWGLCLGGTIFFFKILPQTFLPDGDSGAIMGGTLMPLGTSTAQAREYQAQLNQVLEKDPNLERMLTATGLQVGSDQSTGFIHMVLKPAGKRLPMAKVVQEFRNKFAKLPGGSAFVRAVPALKISTGGDSTASGSRYSYAIRGANQQKVYECAAQLEKKMRAHPGLVDVQTSVRLSLPTLKIKLLRDRASTLGLTAADIENALTLAFAQGKVTLYKTEIDQYQVIVELEKKYQKTPEDLSRIYVKSTATGKMIPLSSIVEWIEVVTPQNVPHDSQLNSATLSFNLKTGVPLGDVATFIEKEAEKILPNEITGRLQGEAKEFSDAIASLGILILIAILIKYVILGILYESYVHPFTIITTLPVGTLGGLATLWIFHSEMSLYAYVGIFMLLGIVAKNGIMMVDFANQGLAEGKNNFDAIHDASVVRFRPILMTGLAAIMGALPIALGYGADGSSRIPLGLVVVGGLVFSQVVTLFVTPGLFLYMQAFQEKVLDRFELTRAGSSRKSES
ncbi:MAG: efflux RND transporter permease subunit [Candidatus Omnitrophota bacterium]